MAGSITGAALASDASRSAGHLSRSASPTRNATSRPLRLEAPGQLDEAVGGPALSGCAAAGMNQDRPSAGARAGDAALGDGAEDLACGGLGRPPSFELHQEMLDDVPGEIIGHGRREHRKLCFGASRGRSPPTPRRDPARS